jgi:acyl-CoA reductase-like NAD-dependent aldehyde dehydrogenase
MADDWGETASQVLERARRAAIAWRETPVRGRLQIVRRVRRLIASEATNLADSLGSLRPASDTLVAEILPLAEAARFLEREADRLLAPRSVGRRGRPAWLVGVEAEIRREPRGVVLVLAPANYPLFLPGVQILQALTAGNAVCAKPAPNRAPALIVFASLLRRAGLPADILTVLEESNAMGEAACKAGFDHIVLTGSAATGVRVLQAAAERLTPCTMELSGDDPVFILPGADLTLAASAIAYGVGLNNGETCIAPRRVFIAAEHAPAFAEMLATRIQGAPPVIPVRDVEHALLLSAQSRYALGAAIFGPEDKARILAERVQAGCVVVNDVIVPTADPRLPFGGRKDSGFGVTRGTEGLLEMTVLKCVAVRRGKFRPHLDPAHAKDGELFAALIAALHGGTRTRLHGLSTLLRLGKRLARRRRN